MQKFITTLFFIISLLVCFSANGFDRVGMLCSGKNKVNDLVFYFNNKKVFNLDLHIKKNEKIINDEFAYHKKVEELGSILYQEKDILFWEKNPWSNFFTYKLDKKNLLLKQRYVLRKKVLSRAISKLFKVSDYYLEENIFKCKILDEWDQIKMFFKFN